MGRAGGMCAIEQMGNDLRRAVRDYVCDENFDGSAAPRFRLDFEILVTTGSGPSHLERRAFLIERKTFGDLYASQRCDASQHESRLDSQLSRLRHATDYRGRLLIVEASDAEWKNDSTPNNFADFIGVKTMLQMLQSQFGDLDQRGLPIIRVLRVRSPVETAQAICELMREALDDDVSPQGSSPSSGRPSPHVSAASRRQHVQRTSVATPSPSREDASNAASIAGSVGTVEETSRPPTPKRQKRTDVATPSGHILSSSREVASTSVPASEAERARSREVAATMAERRMAEQSSRGVAGAAKRSRADVVRDVGKQDPAKEALQVVLVEDSSSDAGSTHIGSKLRKLSSGGKCDEPIDLD